MVLERLRILRKEMKMSQSDVAEFLGIAQTVYSRYERGQNTIPLELLLKLCDLYAFRKTIFGNRLKRQTDSVF